MIAVQLLPTAEFWPRLSKDMKLEGSHSLTQIFLDFTSKDTYRPDAYTEMPAREEFYAYIGLVPVPLAQPAAAGFFEARPPALLILCWSWFRLAMDQHEAPALAGVVIRSPWLLQFRHLLRSLVIGSFALIVLAGYGLDTFWAAFPTSLRSAEAGRKMRSCSPHCL